jgi:hypothetical protein
MEYTNNLRESCLEAIGAIILALRGESTAACHAATRVLGPFVEAIVAYVHSVSLDRFGKDVLERHAVSIIGDLCTIFKGDMKPVLEPNRLWIQSLIQKCQRSENAQTKKASSLAAKSIHKWISI